MTGTERAGVVLMFDDQGDRHIRAELLGENLPGLDACFINLHDKNVITAVKDAAKKFISVDLILMDHVLDKTSAASQELVRKGSSIVPMLREQWDACPILAVTAAYEDCVQDISSEAYEAIFPVEQFARLAWYIPSIIEGYRSVRESGRDVDGLLSLLDAPEDEHSALIAALPDEAKEALGRVEGAHHVFRWFWREFYRQPGFLYDSRWTSLLLGVKQDAFEEYREHIADAEYAGVFKEDEDPRWWKAKVYSLLLPDSPRRFSVPIQEAAVEKLGVKEEDLSSCYKCKEKWPEVMACVDEASLDYADMKPMHLRCTRAHPLASAKPYYEELRVMLED